MSEWVCFACNIARDPDKVFCQQCGSSGLKQEITMRWSRKEHKFIVVIDEGRVINDWLRLKLFHKTRKRLLRSGIAFKIEEIGGIT